MEEEEVGEKVSLSLLRDRGKLLSRALERKKKNQDLYQISSKDGNLLRRFKV